MNTEATPSRSGTAPRVDFVIGNARHHVAAALPVIAHLHERGAVQPRVLSLCELRGQETPEARLREAGAEVVRLVPRAPKKKGTAGAARTAMPVESGVRRLVQALGWHGLVRWSRARKGPQPSLAVIPNDVAFPYDRVLARFQRTGVPTLLLQEGVRFELPGETDGNRYGQGGTDAVAAWGPSAARYFERLGVEPSRIYTTGNPRLDVLASPASDGEAEVAEMDLQNGFVLYVSNTLVHQGFCTAEEKYAGFAAFLRAAEPYVRDAGVQIVVKLHTGEAYEPFERIVQACPYADRIVLCQAVPIYPLIERAGAVLVLASTVGLEAMLMDRPVGLLPVPTVGHVDHYASGDAAPRLTLDEELPGQLRRLLADGPERQEARRRFADDQVTHFGTSAEALADVITLLARSRAPGTPSSL